MSKKLILFFGFIILAYYICYAQTTVFQDDFSTNLSLTWTTSGQIGASPFYVNRSSVDWGARRNTIGRMDLTNDASTSANSGGWVFAYTSTANFTSPYNSILSSNPGLVTWYFNIRVNRANLAGFSTNNYGLAFILGGSNNTPFNSGQGYALVLGNSLAPDPFRLARYDNGLNGSLTSIITGADDIGTNYYSIKITYQPSNNQWELFVRDDGTILFSDPQSGTLTSQGTVTDNTYTGISLGYMGGYWQGSTQANQMVYLDNISVLVNNNPTLPVVLSSFTANVISQNNIQLNWTTQSETNLAGYYIYRNTSSDLNSSIMIPSRIPATNTSQETHYTFTDREVQPGNTYYYWLQSNELNGEYDFHGPVYATISNNNVQPQVPAVTSLLKAYPNPFNPRTTIPYSITHAGWVSIEIFSVRGELLRSYCRFHSQAGFYKVTWDGKDNSGANVASGVYQYRMRFGKYNAAGKVILLN